MHLPPFSLACRWIYLILLLYSYAIVAADASAARSILVFKHDEDKVRIILYLFELYHDIGKNLHR